MQKQLLEIENNLGGFTMKKFLKQLFKKRLNNEKGLTLIELLAVIVILAIIAAIAVPAIGNIINNSRDKAIIAEASNILAAAKLAHIDNACTTSGTTTTCSNEDINEYLDGLNLTNTSDQAVLNDGTWSITYSGFEEIQDTTTYNIGEDNTVTETELTGYLEE